MFDLFANKAIDYEYYSDSRLKNARNHISQAYQADEQLVLKELTELAKVPESLIRDAQLHSTGFIAEIRRGRAGKSGLDAFLAQYELSSQEGIALMCLAESLLRIPDSSTRDKLIQDKIGGAAWEQHIGKSKVLFVNAATYALLLTGKVVKRSEVNNNVLKSTFKRLLERGGDPVVRQAMLQAMKILGRQFVMAETIEKAIKRAEKLEAIGYTYSYDMLGEAARTQKDAEYYYKEYKDAIEKLARAAKYKQPEQLKLNPGISIKLSALEARYEVSRKDDVYKNLIAKLKGLCLLAKKANIGLTVDAEESYRLDLSLDIFEQVFKDPELENWEGLGLAVQAYQKRSYRVLQYLAQLSEQCHKKIMVRLVKGAYWDSEIKYSQVNGLPGYPVFTRKASTDVSYMACAKFLLGNSKYFYAQFATHNAYTLSVILALKPDPQNFEFQRLHGMGEDLYSQVIGLEKFNYIKCRIYAPVGGYKHLLAYLVRRLLENGANSSFVNRIADEKLPIAEITKCPILEVESYNCMPHDKINLPKNIFNDRVNSMGLDTSDLKVLSRLSQDFSNILNNNQYLQVKPIINGQEISADNNKILDILTIKNPSDHSEIVGSCVMADEALASKALDTAVLGFKQWSTQPVEFRAKCLRKLAYLLEENMSLLLALCIKEAGKTLNNAIAEVREAVDFCHYYANGAEKLMTRPKTMPGPTGEQNEVLLLPKGTFVCISPWNFPLAIFLGQIVAALVTGNTVIAKPAEQTPVIANVAINLLYKSGVPYTALQFVPGYGATVGKILTESTKITGVLFTGSCETANVINKTLANRTGLSSIATVVAETGGLNAMIVDSSSLPEQVVRDVIISAFDSAGQRCSSLRLLFVQEEIADSLIQMLTGAMELLSVGNPSDFAIDIGPVIDKEAQHRLMNHIKALDQDPKAKCLYKSNLNNIPAGTYVPLSLYELADASVLQEEFFGPILHLVRYKSEELDQVIDYINSTGYGLTFGIHSRIDQTINYVCSRINAGNCYVNRSMVGAVVGVQPFGGNNLSGTGPKAGGEHYLARLCTEKTISIDTTASGGNASLLCL
ncbi:MAG: bifunctional proline dehydrogenase/L-glutamate gamma-semialdehyde dehydrogenase PutA [Gammaproteobacteria bacterium]|nr:bifunctional proline dehydrogenase/L-glutamate gamma-semialdehyde dehydrogenase PutA [Gammaproteobacteria bacterium]